MPADSTKSESILSAVGVDVPPFDPTFQRLTRLAACSLNADASIIEVSDLNADLCHVRGKFTGDHNDLDVPRQYRLSTSLCRYLAHGADRLVIEDALTSSFTRQQNDLAALGYRAMLSVVIASTDGAIIGSVTALARTPRSWSEADITVLRDVAALVADHLETQQRLDTADSANQSHFDTIATISHELRTPLNGILGMVSVLEQTPLSPEQQQMLALIDSAGTNLLKLIDDLLDVARIDSGDMETVAERFRPSDLIADVCALLRPSDEEKATRLVEKLAPNTYSQILSNPDRIRQVTANLIGNALKYGKDRQISVSAQILYAEENSDTALLEIAVSDQGAGVPDSEKSAMFERFWRSPTARRTHPQGLGLGLNIARGVCERLGGSLTVEDTPGGGATFIARFRVQTAEN